MTRPELRSLPAVDQLAARIDAPHEIAVAVARAVIEERRAELLAGGNGGEVDLVARAQEQARAAQQPSLRRVLNATGVIVHTNLGRAPLAEAARAAAARAAEGYSNLEWEDGVRGSPHRHVEGLLCELTGAEAALAVNNCAGAVLLAAAALAGPGGGGGVSRGGLGGIGGGGRVAAGVARGRARAGG